MNYINWSISDIPNLPKWSLEFVNTIINESFIKIIEEFYWFKIDIIYTSEYSSLISKYDIEVDDKWNFIKWTFYLPNKNLEETLWSTKHKFVGINTPISLPQDDCWIANLRVVDDNTNSELIIICKSFKDFNIELFKCSIKYMCNNLLTLSNSEVESLKSNKLLTFYYWHGIFEDESELLKDILKIESTKKTLEELRKKLDKSELIEAEIEAANNIFTNLKEYPYYEDESLEWWKWSIPEHIIKDKVLICLGYSMLWHAFLNELWIKHETLFIMWHSALIVYIWDSKYLFDKHHKRICKITDEKFIAKKYKRIDFVTKFDWVKHLNVMSWDSDIILLSCAYTNLAHDLFLQWNDYPGVIKLCKLSLEIYPNNELSLAFILLCIFKIYGMSNYRNIEFDKYFDEIKKFDNSSDTNHNDKYVYELLLWIARGLNDTDIINHFNNFLPNKVIFVLSWLFNRFRNILVNKQ